MFQSLVNSLAPKLGEIASKLESIRLLMIEVLNELKKLNDKK
jgi:hypothetical protein